MSHYKPYPKYKNSGVEWLGEVPEGWKTEKISRYFGAKKGINAQQLTKEYCSTIEGSFPVYSGQTENNGVMAYIDRYEFDVGEEGVLFSTTVGAKAMNIMHLKGKFSLSQNCMIILPMKNQLLPRFFFYHFQPLFTYERQFLSEHMQASFRVDDLLQFEFTIPPLEEQSSIASFLDRETTKIDSLITKQNRLIDLLQEKRSALISHAVTKGLDPNVKMKDSGVEWLGEVPEGWEIKRVKHLFNIKKRISGVEGYSVLSITQQGIKAKDIESGDGQLSMDYSKYQFVEVGDFAMNHMDLLTGYIDISSIFGVTSPDYRVFSIRDKSACFDRYYLYLFQTGYKNKIFYSFGQGSSQLGRWRFPTDQFNSFEFPAPPIYEQKQISSLLDRETAKIDSLIAKAHRAIGLLQEHRSSLISVAVTGKIDVRLISKRKRPDGKG